MCCVRAQLEPGIKGPVPSSYCPLLTQRLPSTWGQREGVPPVRMGLRGRGSLASPRPKPQARESAQIPEGFQGTFQDTHAPFQGPDSPAKAVSPAHLCHTAGGGRPALASGPRSEKPR